MKQIKIDRRIIKHLGEDLITSSDVAVIEIIKNSLDAINHDHGEINLKIFANKPTNINLPDDVINNILPKKIFETPFVIFEDNGLGMTDDELENGFLTIGTSLKVNEEHLLGEKGIGRLAAQRLGSSVLVETCSDSGACTSFVYIKWSDVIDGVEMVPSYEGPKSSAHTRLWIFDINLSDFLENAFQYNQMSFVDNFDAQINRNLKSALNFLVCPFKQDENQSAEVKMWFENKQLDIGFPSEMLSLSESLHYFSYSTKQGEILQYGLKLQPWFIERTHRALAKTSFDRFRKPHDFYEKLICKNEERINNALTLKLSKDELFNYFYDIISNLYATKGDKLKEEKYKDFFTSQIEQHFERLSDISPITAEIFTFKQNPTIGEKIIIDSAVSLGKVSRRYTLNELKLFLEDYNGIKLYRKKYRIGFLGNKESDWVKLQQFRTKGQQFYRFDLGNTVGYVSLSDLAQKHIKEISSRLDISENEHSNSFKMFINLVFNILFYELNRKADALIKILLTDEGLLEKNLTQRVKNNNNTLKEMMRRNKQMQKQLSEVSKELSFSEKIDGDRVALSSTNFDAIAAKIDAINDNMILDYEAQQSTATLLSEADSQLKDIEVEAYNNYKLMANGLITESITHELHSISKTGISPDSKMHFDALKEYFVDVSLVKTYNTHVHPIQSSYNSIASKLNQASDLYSFLETTFIRKGAHDVFVEQNISELIESIKQNLSLSINKQKINIICDTGELNWVVPKGVMLHVFYNLINNSIYWIDERRKYALSDDKYKFESEDKITVEGHGATGIIISDTGTGVLKNMVDLLFEPLQSGKTNGQGRGMGLYIVKKLLQSFGGDIELLDEVNEFGNRYKFLIISNAEEDV